MEDYINSTSLELLKEFKGNNLCESPSSTRVSCSNVESTIHSIITKFSMKYTWPVKRQRLKMFDNVDTGIPELRLSSSYLVNHFPLLIPNGNKKDTRLRCVLCDDIGVSSKTMYQCCICKVPLCLHNHVNDVLHCSDPRYGKTHFEV